MELFPHRPAFTNRQGPRELEVNLSWANQNSRVAFNLIEAFVNNADNNGKKVSVTFDNNALLFKHD